MDIESEITNLIHRYQIDECNPAFYQNHLAVNIAREFLKNTEDVILVGKEKSDVRWFKRNICDENTEIIVLENGLFDENEICGKQDRLFLLVSFYGRDKLLTEFLERGLRAVCIYDVFERKGLFFHGNFYDIYGEEYRNFRTDDVTNNILDFDINKIFFYHRRKFELVTDLLDKKYALKKIIFDCVYARDFIQLEKYIKQSKDYFSSEEQERYLLFWQQVEKLLQSIKELLIQRGQQDCLLIWLDALEYGEDVTMPFLNGLNEDSLIFENYYTVTPYTGATFKCLFAKKRVIEEESFKVTKVNEENSSFFGELAKRGYQFKYYGTLELVEDTYAASHVYSLYNSFTQMYWDAIRDILLCNSGKKLFCVLHELFQTHIPYISMGISGNKYSYREPWPGYQADERNINEQMSESRLYVDAQLAYWDKLLPSVMYKIYMSDHGHTFWGRYHCILKVKQKQVLPGKCGNLISNYDFDKLALSILDNNKELILENPCPYVIIQDADYYNKEFITTNLRKKTIPEMVFFGYQGVVTPSDMFIRYNNGIELYRKFRNDESMVTDERLSYLRSIISKKRINIYDEKQFKYSCLLQKVVKQCEMRTRKRQEKKMAVIRKLFEEVSEKDVLAFRGGGIHSIRLLMLLEESLRMKVRYIIDKDKECIAGKLGIKVISMEEGEKYHINKILISSFDYRYVWKEECQKMGGAQVIDLYDLLEREGIICQEEFYKLEYSEEDFSCINLDE